MSTVKPSASRTTFNAVVTTTAIAAAIVACAAATKLIVTIWRHIQTSSRSTDERVMGKWAKYNSERGKFGWARFRNDMECQTPHILLGRNGNTENHVQGNTVWYIDGSKQSCDETGSPDLDPDGQDDKAIIYSYVNAANHELATWVTLLGVIQKMEKYSADWEAMTWRIYETAQPERQSVVDLSVGVQRKAGRLQTHNGRIKPLATTTISHLVELAALLGIHWKEFKPSEKRYIAEGNGYRLVGSSLVDVGILFVFEEIGLCSFMETRVIPTRDIKELCFGHVPTFYRVRDPTEDERWATPFETQETLETLQLGSYDDIAATLVLIGCNRHTISCFKDGHIHTHMFSVIFELVGMLGRTLHIKGRCFTYLPNPTIFQWNRKMFSLRRLLFEFCKNLRRDIHQVSSQQPQPSQELAAISTLASKLNADLREEQDCDFSPVQLKRLHEVLDETDEILMTFDRDMALDVLRCHLQQVLLYVNSDSENVESGDVFLRERELMVQYFSKIRQKVVKGNISENADSHTFQRARHGKKPQTAQVTLRAEGESVRNSIGALLYFG